MTDTEPFASGTGRGALPQLTWSWDRAVPTWHHESLVLTIALRVSTTSALRAVPLGGIGLQVAVRGRGTRREHVVAIIRPDASTAGGSSHPPKEVRFEGRAVVDTTCIPLSGRPEQIWDVFVKLPVGPGSVTAGVPGPESELPALIAGQPYVAYRTRPGDLAIDPTGRARDLLKLIGPPAASVNVSTVAPAQIAARYGALHAVGSTDLTGRLHLTRRGRAAIVADNGLAHLRVDARDARRFTVRASLRGRAMRAGFDLDDSGDDALAISTRAPGGPTESATKTSGQGNSPQLSTGPVKVTVVIATYNTGPALDRAIASLDAQSLRPGEFEVRVVDDGSTDDTYDRLLTIARTRPHFQVQRIANSGWPGRPRNLATADANGEYVLYMDHDDELFPEALERMYSYGVAHDADVVLGKEVKLGGLSTGWQTWRENQPRVEQMDQAVLQCMTPHKLYRRSLIERAELRYMEGRVRLECYHFNAQAYVHARSVAILADYPCYRWVLHESNAHQAPIDLETYWRSFHESLSPLEDNQVAPDTADEIRIRWYTRIVLARLRSGPSPMRDRIHRDVEEILAHFPASLDDLLPGTYRLLSALYRQHNWPALDVLRTTERGVRLEVDESFCAWSSGKLRVRASGRLTQSSAAYPLRESDPGVFDRVVPAIVAEAVDAAVLDVTSDLAAARVEISVRGRESGVEWPIASNGHIFVGYQGGEPTVRFTVSGEIDPLAAAFGVGLEHDVWDVRVRSDLLGFDLQSDIAWTGRPQPAIVSGLPVVAHQTGRDTLGLDVGQQRLTVLAGAELRDPHARRRW